MALSINKKNKKSTKLSSSSSLLTNSKANTTITAAASAAKAIDTSLTRKRAFNQHQYQHQHQHQQQQYKQKLKITKTTSNKSSLTPVTPALQASLNLNADDTLLSTLLEQPIELTQSTTVSTAIVEVKSPELKESVAKVGHKIFRTTTMPSFKIMSYQNIIALITVLVCGLVTVNGLKCYMCGQYNEGVGSITPCLNYSEQYAHLYLKECSKKSEKYCVKYVSELSIVRDCATECAEKEIWETQTYCCTEDGCNGSNTIQASAFVIVLPVVFYLINEIMNLMKQQQRR